MLKEIIIALQAYKNAHRFIKQNKLWGWIIIPGIVYTFLFIISMVLFYKTSATFIEWLSLSTGLKTWLDKMQSSWLGFLFTMQSFIIFIVQMLLYFSWFKFLFLILSSPVFAFLSEKTEAIIEGKEFPFSFLQLSKDIIRGIRIALRNSLWQTVYTFSILIVSFIPIIGWVTPLLVVLIECYYYGFSMLDYSMERHKKSASESIHFIGQHRGLAIGNGLVFYAMHLIPFIGWILAPAYAIIAATLSLYPLKEKENPLNL